MDPLVQTKKVKTVTEIKCTCNECGKVWQYLENEEKAMKDQANLNACVACGQIGSPTSPYYSNKVGELNRQVDKLKKCPSCNSINVTKEKHTVDLPE